MASFMRSDENDGMMENNISIISNENDSSIFSIKNILSPMVDIKQPQTPDSAEIAHQIEESERLAWELMQQDNRDAYNMQVEFMRENADNLDADTLAAIELAMAEERSHVLPDQQLPEPLEDEDGEEEEETSQPWTYDQLLALGEAVGGFNNLIIPMINLDNSYTRINYVDVKTERWRLRCAPFIAQLPEMKYEDCIVSTIELKFIYIYICFVFFNE